MVDETRTTVLETRDGSAFGSTLAWAPTGERLLYLAGNRRLRAVITVPIQYCKRLIVILRR